MTGYASEVVIVVGVDNWICVGRCVQDDDKVLILNGGYCIRRWETTYGLGQICKEGPGNAVLDEMPNGTRYQKVNIIMTLPCDSSKWEGKLHE